MAADMITEMDEAHCAHCGDHHELVVEDLGVHYRRHEALSSVNFSISCGLTMALIGPNGAGKSTLLKAIAGLVKASSGSVTWRGGKIRRWSREFAYLPQREDIDWDFPITVRGLVEMGRYPHLGMLKRFGAEDAAVVDRALDKLELQDLAERRISDLSGGQQQRVFLARSLAQEAHVLLLDEPFTGLDRPSSERLSVLLRDLAEEGRLIIASHHDLNKVGELFDRALLLRRSQVAWGAVSEVVTEENLKQAFDEA